MVLPDKYPLDDLGNARIILKVLKNEEDSKSITD